MAKSIMIQGTGSGVGKSVITAALCRIFLQDGHKVAPFKAQNMALNSFVTEDGGEIGRAQAAQAMACRIKPTVDMNPVLLKPTTDIGAQVILRGRAAGNFSAKLYTRYKKKIVDIVDGSYRNLADKYEVVIIEGAGSPAEINLKSHDIVNMRAAITADAPVIMVGDIDKGGVFAWLIGTLKLLDRKERKRVKGFIINKFRGDQGLLQPGIRFLERQTGIKVLGVIPYFHDIKIPEEDGIYREKPSKEHKPKIGVIRLPHISNHTDFDTLEQEKVSFSYVDDPLAIRGLDVAIIPGTKNTIEDMEFLKNRGFESAIKRHVRQRKALVGICGGFQMLGENILDELNIESNKKGTRGLGYFNFDTVFMRKKTTQQVEAEFVKQEGRLRGYEIHHGSAVWKKKPQPMFIIKKRGIKLANIPDGAYKKDFSIWGTNIHGIFDNYNFRKWFLSLTRRKLGLPSQRIERNLDYDKEIDSLASIVRKNLDMKSLYKILNKKCVV